VNSNLIVESPHSLSATDCLDKLGSSESSGLSNEEAFRRLSIIGENKLRENPAKSVMRLIFDQFEDRLVQILLGVAVFSAILAGIEKEYHSAVEAAVILAILVLNSIIGVVQTKSAESSLDALKKLQPETTNVLRDSQWISDLPTSQLVPGDVIYLRVGDKVPADGRIIFLKTNTFSVDEACLTGESISVQKTVDRLNPDLSISGKANMVFSGTLVTQGACCAVVTATGANTEIGIINSSVQEAKESQTKTPLAQKLDEFGNSLAKAISVICALVFLSAVPKFSNKAFRSPLVGAIHYAKIAVALGKHSQSIVPPSPDCFLSICRRCGHP
jgi:magnesium-transporting ATPase (P-type)